MYSDYLGGLNPERFPRLFKRAIPFRMNMKLSEFVREYICMEQEIHIEDMQESVTQYGRLCRRIRDIQAEVEELTKIRGAFDSYQEKEREVDRLRYFQSALEVLELRELETSVRMQVKNHQEDVKKQELNQKELEKTIGKLEEEKEKLIGKINASGYEELLASLKNLYELQSSYGEGVKNWQDTVRRLKEWEEQEITPNFAREAPLIQKNWRKPAASCAGSCRKKPVIRCRWKSLPICWRCGTMCGEMRWKAIWREISCCWWCRRDMRRMRWKFTGAWTKRNISKWQSWIRRKCQKSAGKYVPGHCRRKSRQKMNLCGHMWTFSWAV